MTGTVLRAGLLATAMAAAVPAVAHASCNVRMFNGDEWVTCFVGGSACTTIWRGDVMISGPVCERVIEPI